MDTQTQRKRRILKQVREADSELHEQIFRILYNSHKNLKFSNNGREVFVNISDISDNDYDNIDGVLTIYLQTKNYQNERNKIT